jgi:hypothetical protein
MKKNGKLIFIIVLLFPAMFKLILEFTTINSKKLSYFGPKELLGKDTVYYSVETNFKNINTSNSTIVDFKLDTVKYPLFVISFIKQAYQNENYRLAGLSEFVQYKKDKIKYIPFVIVTPCANDSVQSCFNEFKKLKHPELNIETAYLPEQRFDSINRVFFKDKPIHIDYSFFVLVDKQRNIRGYYDARFVSEIKRLVEEYQHLRLKEEKQQLINSTKIETK